MSEFIRCPSCGLIVSTRRSARCPRCARPVPGSTATDVATPAPAARPSAPAVVARAPSPAASGAAPAAAAKPRLTFVRALASGAGGVAGIVASKAFGVALLAPAVFGGVTAVILSKAGPRRARPFVPAVSVLAGHAGWMTAAVLLTGSIAPVALDLVLMLAGGAWLVARPGLAPAVALAVFELLAGAVNAWQITAASVDRAQSALVLHFLLRVGVLAGLALGYAKLRREQASATRAALAHTFE